jgi:ankyrin repeat protein
MITNAHYNKMPNKYSTNAAFARMEHAPALDSDLLITAARANDASQIRLLLDGGAEVDAQDAQGWTALSWAVKHRNAAAATALVEAGANSEIEARDGWTPMALAVKGGSPTIIGIAMGGLDRHMVKQ